MIERQYQIEQRKVLRESRRIIEEEVLRYLPTLLADNNRRVDEARFDDLASKIASLFLIAGGKIEALLALYGMEKAVQGIALLINQFNAKQFQRVVKEKIGVYQLAKNPRLNKSAQLNLIQRGIAPNIPGPSKGSKLQVFKLLQNSVGIDTFADNPKLKETLNIWVVNNVNLIKDTNRDFLKQSEKVVMDGVQQGLRHEVLAKKILNGTELEKGRFLTAKTRANLIARDQTNKLNGNLNRLRQTDAGITEYQWRGVLDARERITHVRLEGEVLSWEKGAPSLGGANPGDEIQCRCYGDPVIDLDAILGDV